MNGHGQQAVARSLSLHTGNGRRSPNRQAFTLVELLVVIVIIGILIALLVPTIGRALKRTRDAQMGFEISGLANAIEAYKIEVGDYPPDFGGKVPDDQIKLATHLQRAFRFRNAKSAPPQGDMIDLRGLDPAEALVFWLGGFSGDKKFPLAKREPFAIGTGLVKGTNPFFAFDVARLQDKDNDGWPEYYPENSELPYAYVRADNYALSFDSQRIKVLKAPGTGASGGPVARFLRVYATSGSTPEDVVWAEPDKYQIICAGQDDEYVSEDKWEAAKNVLPFVPSGIGFTEGDNDNITNFSEVTLEDSLP